MANAVTVCAAAPSPTPYFVARYGSRGSQARNAALEPHAPNDSATIGLIDAGSAEATSSVLISEGIICIFCKDFSRGMPLQPTVRQSYDSSQPSTHQAHHLCTINSFRRTKMVSKNAVCLWYDRD